MDGSFLERPGEKKKRKKGSLFGTFTRKKRSAKAGSSPSTERKKKKSALYDRCLTGRDLPHLVHQEKKKKKRHRASLAAQIGEKKKKGFDETGPGVELTTTGREKGGEGIGGDVPGNGPRGRERGGCP